MWCDVMLGGSKSGLALCKCCLCQIRLSPVITTVASRTFRRLNVQVLPLSLRQPGCPVPNCCNYYSALVRRPSQWKESCIFQSQVYSYIQGVLKCLNKFQQGWVFYSITMQNVRISTGLCIESQSPRPPDRSPLYLYPWRHLNTVRSVFSCKCNWRHFTNPFFLPVRPFASALGPLKSCDGRWSDVSVWPLIELEGVWCVCCEVWFSGQSELSVIKWKRVLCI